MEADFSGYATKAGLKCSDGRTIMPDAFSHQDKMKVPLVWQHGHNEPANVLGHAVLEHRKDGVYAYGFFNDTEPAKNAKALVEHGDISMLSIWANQLVEKAKQVFHGSIKEVSLVLSGANPGALIDQVRIAHADGSETELDDEAIIYTGLELEHSAKTYVTEATSSRTTKVDGEVVSSSSNSSTSTETVPDGSPALAFSGLEHGQDSTVQEVYDTLSDEQKDVVHFMIGAALEQAGVKPEAKHSDVDGANAADATQNEDNLEHKEGNENMSRNVFDQSGAGTETGNAQRKTLTHAQVGTLIQDAMKSGSLKESLLAHVDEYGITNIEVLFPDAKTIDSSPQWITRRMEWVDKVLNGCRKLPFSKIKSMSADLTLETARAKGYVKATMKKEQFFAIAARETGPKTIYKKQKLDRDDIVDITDFDVVAWVWVEMRFMLREEIARAILIGDGREVDDPDKIDEDKIRPIATDSSFYTDVVVVAANVDPSSMVEAVIRARENYEGAGNPTMFTTRSIVNDMLLQKDKMGRRLYRNRGELAAELEVDEIVDVPVMADAMTDDGDLLAVFVNLSDYSIGSTRGGEVTTFDDFDIDFNQYKYLIEGRMSGALTKHKTAQVLVRAAGTSATPEVPTFVNATGVVTIPTVTGVEYHDQSDDSVLTAGAQTALSVGETLSVVAVPTAGYYFPHNIDADWDFTRTA
jgi:HK97 family phage prohead protease